MQARDLAGVLAVLDNLEVGLVPGCRGCETRAGELGQGMEEEAVDDQAGPIQDNGGDEQGGGRGRRDGRAKLGSQLHGSQLSEGDPGGWAGAVFCRRP